MQTDAVALDGNSVALPPAPPSKQPQSQPAAGPTKHVRPLISVPRLDYEPIYAELKACIGDKWASYKDAITLFLLGHLNQREFSSKVDSFLLADAKLVRLHNHFICAVISNLTRDLPDHGVASWVSSNDKPAAPSKPVQGDAAEQRLKTEVMHLQPKDRRRVKAIQERARAKQYNPAQEFYETLQVRLPDQVPASAGGLNKTNWELEIRKRYSQPLATEVGEFPDAESIHSRMVPICYEESVVNGPAPNCATYVAIATENYVKDFLSIVFSRTRSNGPSGTINGTMTRNYRLQLEQEELAFTRGDLARNAASGLLPVEAAEASTRQGLSAQDLKFATEMGGGILGHQPLVMNQIMNGYTKDELEAESEGYTQSLEGVRSLQAKQTLPITAADGTTEDYEDQMDWEGADTGDQQQLGNLLDECLSMAV